MKPLLEVRHLSFSYASGPPVLNDISLQIQKGEFVAITGPSGSGKSTLFYLLGALTDRFKGDILFSGRSYRQMNAVDAAVFRNQNIGFVFQQFYLLPRASVLDNILLPAHYPYDSSQPTDEDKKLATKIATDLGIEMLLSRRPQELSGGQQQRVALARALLRNPDLILADEPTGNLDSKATVAVFDLLREFNRQGKTVIVITHSLELANACARVIRFKDGKIEEDREGVRTSEKMDVSAQVFATFESNDQKNKKTWSMESYRRSFRPAIENIRRSRAKSFLTMLGVVLGIAAVLSTLSLGDFTKRRVLAGYESMGVNNLQFTAWPNWRRNSRDFVPTVFQTINFKKDIDPLRKIFSEIQAASPLMRSYEPTINFGGNSVSEDTSIIGINEEYYAITNQSLKEGRPLTWLDVEMANPVCVIGDGIRQKLFRDQSPINKQITLVPENQDNEIPCRVVGSLQVQPSNNDNFQPDNMLYMPYTSLQKALTNPWEKEVRNLQIKIASGHDPILVGKQIEGYFKSRYGNSGNFSTSSNAKAIAEMRLFIAIFTSLLTAVAMIALIVGGVGINNMMLVNLAERLKELGLRKALGATPRQIRALLLTESLVLCSIGGVLGLLVGVVAYHGLIFAATKLIPNLVFEWVFLWSAIFIASAAVILTGILSGLTPALKAERLQVIDALRQE